MPTWSRGLSRIFLGEMGVDGMGVDGMGVDGGGWFLHSVYKDP